MEETRSEQLAQKVTPTVRAKLDEILKRMGHHDLGKDGHVKWDQDVLEKIIAVLEEKYPDCEVEVNNGGQPIYYYIISVE